MTYPDYNAIEAEAKRLLESSPGDLPEIQFHGYCTEGDNVYQVVASICVPKSAFGEQAQP